MYGLENKYDIEYPYLLKNLLGVEDLYAIEQVQRRVLLPIRKLIKCRVRVPIRKLIRGGGLVMAREQVRRSVLVPIRKLIRGG